jgi:cytochrome c556
MKFHRLATAIFAASTLFAALPAAAQFAKAEDAIKYRQSAFIVMAAHFSRVGAMVSGKVPFDAKVAQDNFAVAESLAKLPYTAFGPGTEGGKALPEVWSEAAKFKTATDKMHAEIGKLGVAMKTGNLDVIKAAFGPTAASCKACHDDFHKR